MPLTEEQAGKIILVRSIEEAEPGLFSPQLLHDALANAGSMDPGLGWVEKRAAYLFEHIPSSQQAILQLIKLPSPWTLPICGLAFVVGVATNLLGPFDRIHVVRNAVLALVAWNLLVYLANCVLFALRRPKFASSRSAKTSRRVESFQESGLPGREAAIPWIVRLVLPGIWQFFHKMVFGFQEKKTLADVITRFRANWFRVAGGLVVARWKCVLHLAALSLATGAVAGMYLRGLLQGYKIVWDSTFVTEQRTVTTLIDIIFAPSLAIANLFNLGLAERISVPRLMSLEGDEAAAWIHLFAIAVAITVVIPRALLAAWQWRAVKSLANGIVLPLDRYHGDLIEAPIRSFVEKEVRLHTENFSEAVADFVSTGLYDEQIVPRLRSFREAGGRIEDLKADINSITESFLPELAAFIANKQLPELQRSLSAVIGEMLKEVRTDFTTFSTSEDPISELKIAPPELGERRIAGQLGAAATVSIGSSIAVALAAVGGGLGEELGIAVIATLLGTTGPVGFLLGLLAGGVLAATAWWYGGSKITEAIERVKLPAAVVSTVLWESRFQRMIHDGRNKCKESVKASIEEKLKSVKPKIADEILFRARQLWLS